jgi:hypothetical protein
VDGLMTGEGFKRHRSGTKPADTFLPITPRSFMTLLSLFAVGGLLFATLNWLLSHAAPTGPGVRTFVATLILPTENLLVLFPCCP